MSDDQVDEDAGALFAVDQLVPDAAGRARLGRIERGLMLAIKAGTEAGTIIDQDAGLCGAALGAARQLDYAEAMGQRAGLKAGYLYAQLLTPYRETCQALRLPAEVVPTGPPPPDGDAGATGVPSWVHDAFGSAE